MSKSYGVTANGYAYGINLLTVLAGSATASGLGATAIAGAGTIGAIDGSSTAIVTASAATVTVHGVARGIEKSDFAAGYAAGYNATAGAGTVGAITGTAVDYVNGDTFGPAASLDTIRAYGISGVNVSAGQAAGTNAGSVATGAKGTVGDVTGSITDTDEGTVNEIGSNLYANHLFGIYNLSIDAGGATAALTAIAGPGYVATGAGISGKANVTVNGDVVPTSGTYIIEGHTAGISGLRVNAGSATANAVVTSTATGATGQVGAIYGKAQSTFTGVDNGTVSSDNNNIAGLFNANVYAGQALGYMTATAGAGTVGSLTGLASTVFNSTVTGAGVSTGVDDSYGITNVTVAAGNAVARSLNLDVATGAAGQVGAIFGDSTIVATGTTTGTGVSNVYADASYGLDNVTVHAGTTAAYRTATAGTGAIGAITGDSGVTITKGTTSGDGSAVSAYGSRGIYNIFLGAGGAYADFGYGKSVATADTGTIGTISGLGFATVTGITTGKNGLVGAGNVYGIDKLNIIAGYAGGYKAVAAVSNVATAGITGSATATVTATTKDGGTSVYSGTLKNSVIAINAVTLHASTANATNLKLSSATGAAATIGNISGIASGTSTENGTGENNSFAYVQGIDGNGIFAGGAYGGTALAGAGTLGSVYGKATATAGSAIATGNVYVHAYGLDDVTINAGVATSGYAKGTATAAASSVGVVTGEAYSTATGSQAKTATSQVSHAYATGIDALTVTAGVATSPYKAYAGAGSVGAMTGTVTATATGFKATVLAKGIDPTVIKLANAYGGSIAKSVTTAAAGTITSITATATTKAYGAVYTAGIALAEAYGLGYNSGYESFILGYAKGLGAAGGSGSSVGKVSGAGTSTVTGYSATSFAIGLDRNIFSVGVASGSGKVTAGSGSVGAGTGVYGNATATATSTATKGTLGAVDVGVFGIFGLQIKAANAYSTGATKGNYAYGAYGEVGKLSGIGLVTGTVAVGAKALGYGIGIANDDLGFVPRVRLSRLARLSATARPTRARESWAPCSAPGESISQREPPPGLLTPMRTASAFRRRAPTHSTAK